MSTNTIKFKSFEKSDKITHFKQDVWSIFTPLAQQLKAANLGQGFMDFPPPDFVIEAASDVINNPNYHQYSHPKGRPNLKEALAKSYSPLFKRTLDPDTEILPTAGANEGLYATFSAFLNPGDEVVLIEPFFDQYIANITMNGGVPVYVPLRPQGDTNKVMSSEDWKLDMNELRSKLTSKSKIIVFNTPHNPVGKVFSLVEMAEITKLAEEFNLIIISDEVYDRLYYEPHVHERIANLPGAWERTITVGSGGKTFGTTGWRVGWLIGPKNLVGAALSAQTRIVFCVNTPLQEALASSFNAAEKHNYFEKNIEAYTRRREKLMKVLTDVGLPFTIPQGSYFILANTAKVQIPEDYPYPEVIQQRPRDFKVCYWMAKEIGVVAIPPSEFYCKENAHLAENLIRLAFCKTDKTLDEAAKNFQKLKRYIKDV
ncbi:15702_t:CDS:2 [Funneliformis caledonium]|uniref:kynurenine--oxoglutarate transaminase n=1 Tax=Funneliformis caledonium TaxID=1117310 RepID=A0A9N8WP20_9GLOM|nr:15702_t:CDS:2 [Funneliformis caledonium]